MMLLELTDILKDYSGIEIFGGISVNLREGEVVGLVGDNGVGKSTLCNIIAGVDTEFDGRRYAYPGVKISYFKQLLDAGSNDFSDITVFDYVLESQKYVLDLETNYLNLVKRLEYEPTNQTLLKDFENLQDEYLRLEAYALTDRIENVLNGLGITQYGTGSRKITWEAKIRTLSGGERKILELATILLDKESQVLILDEPTNHLDLHARKWLSGFIKSYKGAIVLVSHDRYLLTESTSTTWEISKKRLTSYPGNYEKFLKLKAQALESKIKQYELERRELARLEVTFAEIKRRLSMAPSVKMAKQYQAFITRMDKYKAKMIPDPREHKPPFLFSLAKPVRFGRTVFEVQNLIAKYGDRILLDNVSFKIENGDKVVLLGKNGSGKSSLFNILFKEFAKQANVSVTQESPEYSFDKLYVGPGVKLGYYSQTHSYLPNDLSVRDYLKRFDILTEGQFQKHIRKYQFSKDTVDMKLIGDLSGGEKSKLQFMTLELIKPNVLLLDEPINHLDISSMIVVESILKNFTGTIIVISHDRHFLNEFGNKVLYLNDMKVETYSGTFNEVLDKYIP